MNRKKPFFSDSDEEIEAFLKEQSFIAVRKLDDGTWIGMLQLMFTMSVCVGITATQTHTHRWCFGDPIEASIFFGTIEHPRQIPEKRESLKGHRYPSGDPLLIEKDELGFDKW